MGIKIMMNNISFNYTVSKGEFDALNVNVVINQTSLTNMDVDVKVKGSTSNGSESVDLTIVAYQYKLAGELNGSVKVNGNLRLKGVDYKIDFENKFTFTEEEIKEIYSPENICKIIDMIQAMSSVKDALNSTKSKFTKTEKTAKKSHSRHGNHVHVVPAKEKKEEVWGEL